MLRLQVALRGVLKVEDGRLFWAGKWADDDGAFERGETKKFKYGGPADCDDAARMPAPREEEKQPLAFFAAIKEGGKRVECTRAVVCDASLLAQALAAPPAGKWNGYFMNPSEEDELGKVREKGVELKFVASKGDKSSLAVTGTGENDFGAFTLRGTYTIASQRLECSKFYASNADDEEDDDDDLDPDAVDDNYDDELAGLNEEQDMPIEELMKRYGKTQDEPPAKKLRN